MDIVRSDGAQAYHAIYVHMNMTDEVTAHLKWKIWMPSLRLAQRGGTQAVQERLSHAINLENEIDTFSMIN